MKKVKIGIIGLGWFGNFHLENLLKMENVCVTALAAWNQERLAAAGEKAPEAALYEDYHTMFEQEQLDGVVICVTPSRHGDIEAICCEKGIPFYVEKPLGIDEATVLSTASMVKAAGVLNAVGYQERYNPAIAEIKMLIQDKPVGLACGSWIGGMPGSLWWRTKAQSGGQVVEQTTHIVDMFRYLFGDVASVYAAGGTNKAFSEMEHDVEDYSTAVLQFKNGITASLQSGNYLKSQEISRVGFDIYTEDIKIEYKWSAELKLIAEEATTVKKAAFETHFTSLKTFTDAVASGDASAIRSDYEDASKSCLVTLAINKSMETGQVVYL